MEKQIRNYLKILETSPDNVPAFEALATIYQDQERWGELAAIYEERAGRTAGSQQVPDLLFKAADIYAERLAKLDKVEQCLQKVLDADPLNARALKELKERYRDGRQWEALIRLLEQEAGHRETPNEQADLFTEAAVLWLEELGNESKQVEALRLAQQAAPEHLDSLRRLKAYYFRVYDVDHALELVEREDALLDDKKARGELYLEVGLTLAEDPFEKERAVTYLNKVLELQPKSKAAKKRLEELDSLDQRWEKLTRRYQEEAINISDKREASAIYLKVAAIYYLYAPDRDEDIMSAIEKGLILDANNRRAMLLGERFLLESESWLRLADFYRDIVERTFEEPLKVEAMDKAAKLFLDKLDRRSDALELYRQIIQLDAEHNEAYRQVESDLAEREQWDQLKDLLNDRLGRCYEASSKFDTHLGLARLAETQSGDIAAAIQHLEQARELNSASVEAARKLVELYTENGRWEELLDVYPVVLDGAADDGERRELELKLGELLRTRVGKLDPAFTHYAAAFELDATDEAVWGELEELTIELERWEDLVALLGRVLDLDPKPANWRSLKFRLGQIYDRELSQYEDAEACYQELLDDEAELDVLDALSRLYSKDLRWENMVDVLNRKARITEDMEERRDVLMERARIFELELIDAESAIAAYQDVLAVDPDELDALKRLEELHEEAAQWEELGTVIVRELEVITSLPEKVNLNFKLGNIRRRNLDDAEGAAKAYLAVLDTDPAHLPAIEMLEELLNEGVLVNDIFRGLESYYRKLERFDKLAAGYEALILSEEDAETRGALCHKLADLYFTDRSLPEDAFSWIKEGLKTPYQNADFLKLALEASRKLGKQSDLLDLLEAKAGAVDDDDQKVRLALSLGALYWEGMQDAEQAEHHYLTAAETRPDEPETLNQVAGFFEQTEQWVQLAAFGEKLAAVQPDPADKAQTLFKIADVYERRLDKNDSAQVLLNRVLESDPDNLRALDELLRLQEAAEQWEAAVLTLLDKLEKVDDPAERIAVKVRLAAIHADRLDDYDEAAKLNAAVLAEDPQHVAAFAAMDRFREEGKADRIVAETLRPIFEDRRDFDKLIHVLTIQYGYAEGDDAYQLAVRVASLYEEEFADYVKALEWYGKAFLDGRGVGLLKELALCATETNEQATFIILGDDKLEQELEDAERVSLLFALAETELAVLEDTDAARQRYLDILDVEAENEAAIDALIDLARARDDASELADLLEKKCAVAAEKNVRRESALEMADLRFRRLGDPDRSLEILSDLMEERENDPQVFDKMEEIYGDQERYADLLDLLERKLKYLREDDEILPVKIQIGSLLENNLDRRDEAMELYLELVRNYWNYPVVGALVDRLLAQDTTQLTIANEMEQKYIKVADWKRLVNVYEIQIRHEEDTQEKAKLLAKLSNIYQEKLQDPEKAFEGFARVFIDDCRNEAALEELEKLAGELGAWKELAEVYENAGTAAEEDDESTTLFIKAARLYEDILAFQEDSIRAYRKVLDRDRNNMTAIGALEGLCRKTERWEELRDIYLQRIELTEDIAEKKELYQNICILFEHQLDDPMGTTPYYEQVLDLTPQDIEVVDHLLGLYTQQEQWEKLAGLLAHKISLIDYPAEQNRLKLDKAVIHEERLDDFVTAKDLYKDVITVDSADEEALIKLEEYVERDEFQAELAQFMEPFYRDREDWNRMIDMQEHQFSHSDDIPERVRLLKAMAQAYEDRLDQTNMAYGVFTRAFRERPTDDFVQSELERLAGLLGMYEQLATLYLEEIDKLDSDTQAADMVDLLMNLAHITETYLQEVETAAGYYRHVLELHPDHPEALGYLERIYSLQKKWPELIEILESKNGITEGLEDKKNILFQICNIFEEELGQNLDAIGTYERMLEMDDSDDDVLRALVRLSTVESLWDKLIAMRSRQLEIAETDEQRWDLRYAIGMVYWEKVSDWQAAFDVFAGVLSENNAHPACREAMEGMLVESDSELAAARFMEPIYTKESLSAELIDVLAIQAEYADAGEPKRDLFLRMADLAEIELNLLDRAFAFTVSAFINDVPNEAIREQMERLAAETNRFDELAAAYRNRVAGNDDVALQVDVLLNAGRICLREQDDPAAAEADYSAARERQGDNLQALDALEEIFERLAKWEELVDVFFTKADLSEETAERIALYTRAAETREHQLSEPNGAVDCYLKVLDVDADHLPTLNQLDRLYAGLADWSALRGILARRVALADEKVEKLELTYRMGRVIEERLEDAAEAFDVYRSILDDDDEYLDAIRSLEHMIANLDLQSQVLDVLAPLFEAKGWWERLADLLESQFDTLGETAERIAVLGRIKSLYEHKLSDASRAFQVACRIFEEDFHDQDARLEMERLAVVTGGFEGLVNTYRAFFDQVADEALKLEILTKIARIYEEQLQNPEEAVESYRGVLKLDPKNFTAMLALDRLYEHLEQYSDLVELIPNQFELFDDPKEVIEQRLRLGALWEEKLQDNLTAIDVYRQVLDEQPDNAVALAALERLYEAEEEWPELIEIYKAEVRIARGDTKKARLYGKMAQVLYEKLGQAREAIPLWNRVLQFDEQNEQVMVKLEELYQHEEMWNELVAHYKKRLRGARGGQERAALTKRMAGVYRLRLEREDMATQLYLKVLEYTPDDLEVIDTLEEIYLANQNWRELAELLKRLVPKVQGDELRSLYLRLASIQVERIDNLAEGESLARQVLGMEPTLAELGRLERMFQNSPAHELHMEILEKQATASEDESDIVALNFRMADLWQDRLNNLDKTRQCLERVLSLRPGNLQAAELLEPIYRRDGAWTELIGILEIRLSEAFEKADQADLYRQMAEIYETRLQQPEQAFGALAEVFRRDPSDEALLAHLEELAESTGKHLELAHLVRDILPQIEADARLYRVLVMKVARLYEEKAENPDLAAEYFKMFLETGAYDDQAVDFLIDYYETIEDWQELVDAYHLKVPHMNLEQKVIVGVKVGHIFDTHLGETDRAIRTLQQVLKMDDACLEANDALIGIFQRLDRYEDLVEQLRHKLHMVIAEDEISAIRLSIARLYQERLDDLGQAKVYYRSIIADDPKHQEALDQLEHIYESEANYDELLEVLSRRVNVAEADADKLSIYRKMADIWETKFEQLDMAVNYLEKMLAIQPNNMEAIATLERIYREAADWPALASTYQRHIDQVIDADEIVRLYTEMGKIYGEYLFQPAKAIEYFQKALKIDETNLGVMRALSELYIANEKWDEAIETLDDLAGLADDKAERVDALARLGQLYLDNLGDREKAKAVFDRMVAEDPTFVPALRALRQYYAATENWPEFLRMVEEEKRYVEDPREKAELLYEEGRYYHDMERDVDGALTLYREALELADTFAPVLRVLGHIYFERQEWEAGQNVLARLLDLPDELTEADKAQVHYKLAYISEQQNDDSEALKHYTASYKLDSNNLATLEGLARALYKREDWERAFRVYQTILVRFRERKSVPELVELFCRLGEVNGQIEKNDVAVRMYEKALELDPESVRALKAIVFFYESLENWKKVLQFRSKLIKRLQGDELFEQWRAIGDVYSDRLDAPDKGLEAYRYALEIKANDVELLAKVSKLLVSAGNIEDAIGVLKSAVSIETDPDRLIFLDLELGNLLREHDENPEACLTYYNHALDLKPERLDVFEMIEDLLLKQENWEELDNNYRLMIARLPNEQAERRLDLWKKLGTLLADKAGNLDDAIKAWEVVAQLEPDNEEVQEHIADLYARSPEYREQAIAMHRSLIAKKPERINSYRALWKISFESEHFDEAFCFGSAVAALGETEVPAAAFYKENLHEVKREAINTLDRQLWGSLLLHEDARHNVGQILNILFHHMSGLMPSDLRKENLKKKDRLDLGEHLNFCTTTTYILKALGLPQPDIYTRKGYGPGVEPLPIRPAGLLIGADAFENYPQRELVFLVAKNAVLARPDFLTTLTLPAEQIRSLLDASTLLFDAGFKGKTDAKTAKNLSKQIDRALPKKLRPTLSGFVSEYAQIADDLDIDRWRRALVLSANRAGMLMCNDLSTAIETLKKHKSPVGKVSTDDLVADLIAFSISEAYFHLRNYLGFSIL